MLYKIVDQDDKIYASRAFNGYYTSKDSAERAKRLLPKHWARYGTMDDGRWGVVAKGENVWRIQATREEWYDVS